MLNDNVSAVKYKRKQHGIFAAVLSENKSDRWSSYSVTVDENYKEYEEHDENKTEDFKVPLFVIGIWPLVFKVTLSFGMWVW